MFSIITNYYYFIKNDNVDINIYNKYIIIKKYIFCYNYSQIINYKCVYIIYIYYLSLFIIKKNEEKLIRPQPQVSIIVSY